MIRKTAILGILNTKLKKLALAMVPLAFIACQEPNNNNGNQGPIYYDDIVERSAHAETVIGNFKTNCEFNANTGTTTMSSLSNTLNMSREGHMDIIKGFSQNYTHHELDSYNNRMIVIIDDTLYSWYLKFGKNIAMLPLDILDKQ